MTSPQEFHPNWASSPGDTIADALAERNISESDFAHLIGQSIENTKSVLEGRATITIGLARQLERVLGASVEFWMARDFRYREHVERLHAKNQHWLSQLPLGDMLRFGWLKPVPHPSEQVSACLRFFGVQSVTAWYEKYSTLPQVVAFRTSPSFNSHPGAVATWLREGELESAGITCERWNSDGFRRSLSLIRGLTREKDPHRFIPQLQKVCSANGVAVVIVRAPNGCRASGATWFSSRDKAVLLLSFRHLSDDQFWFSFFHESGHLLLHGISKLFLEGLDTSNAKEEQEANDFAGNVLVPPEAKYSMLGLPRSAHEIIRFARQIGIAPGIVVGQLQHLKKLRHNQMNSLKRRFTWEE